MNFEHEGISAIFHWSGGVLSITIVVLLVLVGSVFFVWPCPILWLRYLLIIIFIASIIVGLGYMPIRLEVNNKQITLKRLFGPLEIPINTIVEINQIPKSEINGSIRTFGSGGFFGYLGQFKNNRLGNYTMYATELNNLMLIRTNNKTYVFSCTRAKELIKYINSKL